MVRREDAGETTDDAIDFSLMERTAAGDEEAFRQLVERHRNAVVGTVASMLGSASEAEDIAQRAFLRVWNHARNYRPEARFTTYLFTIVRNLVFNETRRKIRKNEVSADDREERFRLVARDDGGLQPDSALLDAELRDAVNRAIRALPDSQRMAVLLRRHQGLPYEEIATTLEMSVPAVKSLLFRARTSLREALADYLDT
jgi:RNA polymerase sigma-70 factor (ECF subfamily)